MSDQGNAAASTDAASTAQSTSAKPAKVSITKNRKMVNRPSFNDRQERAAKASNVQYDKNDLSAEPDAGKPAAEAGEPSDTSSESPAVVVSGTPEERLAAIKDLLEKGDLAGVAAQVQADKKAVDTSNEKYAVLRRKQEKIDKGVQHLASEETRLTNLAKELRTEFGEPREFKRLYKSGKFSVAAKILQQWLGEDFGTITRNIAREVAGLDPKEKQLLEAQEKLERERAELAAERNKTQSTQTQAQKKENALKTVAVKCTGHDVLKLKNGAALVLAEMEAAWDPDQGGFRITYKQAADAVLEKKLEDAKALGYGRAAAETKKTETKETPKETVVPRGEKVGRFTQRKSFEERNEAARLLTLRSRHQ